MVKKLKFISIFVIILSILFSCCYVVYGFGIEDLDGSTNVNGTKIATVGNQVLSIVTTIASIVSVIVIIVLGIKYMAGSVEEKATYKKSMMPYLIGALLAFAASGIYKIIYNILTN